MLDVPLCSGRLPGLAGWPVRVWVYREKDTCRRRGLPRGVHGSILGNAPPGGKGPGRSSPMDSCSTSASVALLPPGYSELIAAYLRATAAVKR
jgi:hypothetical protein